MMKKTTCFSHLRDNRCAGFGRIALLLALPLLVIIIFAAYHFLYIPSPSVKGLEAFDYLPADKTISLNSENIQAIEITIHQDGKTVDLLKDSPETNSKSYSLQIRPKAIGIKDGKASVTVKAAAGMLKKVQYDIEALIDTVPPSIDVESATQYISPGSSGFSILKASGEDSVYIKVVDKMKRGDDKTFKAYSSSSGINLKPPTNTMQQAAGSTVHTYYAFFPAFYDMHEGTVFYAVATDLAGNQSVRALPTRLKMIQYNSSSISVDDQFIHRVVSPLLNETNLPDPAAAFKKANEDLRQQSLDKLIEISRQTEPEIMWEGSFLQLKNSKVMATYGDKRTYLYNGAPISKSVHLGYDLASLENAPVEAANSGIVRFAEDLSIYGNTIIIDHGLGLMSLYGHLASMSVREGQKVAKGEIIARTGATGLAGGDHLHFGLLVHGYEVSPLYWWDAHWIRVNITDYLKQ